VLADPVRNLDWKARRAKVVAAAPPEVVAETLGKLTTLLA
jgi:mRNA-degrading endonuclease toxin of MazEF toxin-antitoxin module